MDYIMMDNNLIREMGQRIKDDSFIDIIGDIDTFSDTSSESNWSDIGILDNLQDSTIFKWDNAPNFVTYNNTDTETYKSKYLDTFEPARRFKFEDSQSCYISDPNSLDIGCDITVPVINVEEIIIDDQTVEEDEEDEISVNDVGYDITVPAINMEEIVIDDQTVEEDKEDGISVNGNLLQPSKRRLHRKYSSTDDAESDEEWAPQPLECFKKKPTLTRRVSASKTPSKRPVPQRRSPGTKLKITQWIVKLLRDPKYNPKVITWVDEKRGVFLIKDTAAYAKLWGKIKQNTKMTYEKLSRAMRYSYKNDELRMVPEQRLTYKFGPNMVNFRAENPEDPNFELVNKTS
eukprot:GFUD01005143.1.p1 GENE.GFUD01005143.1~~GFUD01005143.1.p1  ORF type:complete len:346 (+),score=90.90 GFUD01005143.1:199-1236(+)